MKKLQVRLSTRTPSPDGTLREKGTSRSKPERKPESSKMKSNSNSSVQANEDEELTQALEAVDEVATRAIAVAKSSKAVTEVIAVDIAETEVTVDAAEAEAEAAETAAAIERTSQQTGSATSATLSVVISQETAR